MLDERAAALAFTCETQARCADHAGEWEHGTLLRTPSLDQVWAVNGAIAHGPPPELGIDEVDALLARRFPGRFASCQVEDGPAAARLEAQARERGWRIEHELYMALRREPDRVADTSGVREGTEEEIRPLMARWNEEEHAEAALRAARLRPARPDHARGPRAEVTRGRGVLAILPS